MRDRTMNIEKEINESPTPSFTKLLKMWSFVFFSSKTVSIIYLGLFIILSLFKPVLAFIWGMYIRNLEQMNTTTQLLPTIMLIIAYFIINFILEIIHRYTLAMESIERLDVVQANRQQESLHAKIYKKLAKISPEYFEIPKINDKITQMFDFADDREEGLNSEIMLNSYIIISSFISLVSIALSLYFLNPWLCIIVLLAPLSTVYSLTLEKKLKFKFVSENTTLKRKIQYFQDLLISTNSKEIKTLGVYDYIFNKWKELADEYTIKEKKMIRNKFLLQMIGTSLLILSNSIGVVVAIVLMINGIITLYALAIVMSLIDTLINNSDMFLHSLIGFIAKKNESALFQSVLDIKNEDIGKYNLTEIKSIEAKNIIYRYPSTNSYVLNGINLTISKGERIAFVGENGMGKTTLVKIISGLLTPSSGELLINDIDFEMVNIKSRYSNTSMVAQTPVKYTSLTVAENIYLGDTSSDINMDSINSSLHFAELEDTDSSSVLGKDIGGTDISSGQWQKLAIAKANYRNRNFIILDEPTSNLDPLAETEIFQKYLELSNDKTVIFVTHRISVASLADRIIVIKDGLVAQDGTHEELINVNGEYKRLFDEQAKWYNR